VRRNLTVDDLGDLLDQPLLAVLATFRADGTVLLSPVWHEWRDGGFNIWVEEENVKTRHLRRDPRATILVAEAQPPFRGVEVRAEARFVRKDVRDTAVRVAARYLGPGQGAAYVDAVDGTDVIVRLAPGRLRTWDFADEYGAG
jgi:PPOX class probable F420-dependent enzyme